MSSNNRSNNGGGIRPYSKDDVVIVSAVRTPMCRSRKGSLAKVPPSTLLSTVLKGCIDRCAASSASASASSSSSSSTTTPSQSKITYSDIDDICVGNVLNPPAGAAAMRMAQLEAGIPHTVPLHVINRQCSSGLQAVAHIANAIRSKQITIGIGCGVESMSMYPMNKMKPPDVDWVSMSKCSDAMDCLIPMGVTSENVCKKFHMDRMELDKFSLSSHIKAFKAQENGIFDNEIINVGNVTKDDGIRPQTTINGLSKLRPVFVKKGDEKNGITTAGNSSQTTDGAAAILLMTRNEAMKRNLPILGIWHDYDVCGVPPSIMGIGPAVAIPRLLEKTGLHKDDVDIYEINEAFASQALYSIKTINIPMSKVNPNGGAIALGHPLGATGARQIVTLLNELSRNKSSKYGIVSMCIGTGMGAAALIEVEHGGGVRNYFNNNNNNSSSNNESNL